MQSIYKTILSKFFTASLIPILVIEISLIISLFWLNHNQTSQNKASLKEISEDAFLEISKHTALEIKQHFSKATDELLQLRRFATDMFNHPTRYMDSSLALRYDQGFFRDGKKGELSSIYTTNVKKMTPKHEKNMQILSLLAMDVKQVVEGNKKLIQSAWVNIGKYYSLFYPKLDVPNELTPNLDVTKQRFYFEADAKHNPSKGVIFIDLYKESWATQFGQMGAYLSPIYQKRKFIGVIGVNVTVEKSAQTFSQMQLPFNAYAMLIDSQNRLLVSSDENRSFEDLQVRSFNYEYLRHKETNEHDLLLPVDIQRFENSDKVIFSQPIEGTSLRVLFCANESDIYGKVEAISQNAKKFGYWIIAAIAFFYTLYFLYMFKSVRTLAYKISVPLRRIADFSSVLGKDERFSLKKSYIEELNTLNNNLETTHHKLIRLVNYDESTRIFNHRKLREDIDQGRVKELFLFHLKSFDDYNNIFGPKVGNAVLLHVIGLIQSFKKEGTLYRENKDTIALAFSASTRDVKGQMQFMLEKISDQKFHFEGIDVNITLVGGISLGRCDDSLGLLSQAHIALTKAKEHMAGRFVIYDEVSDITKQYEDNIYWGQQVKDALAEGRLEAFFQPIYNYENQKIEKCESLVRMRLDGEVVSPFKFLHAAKHIGKLHEITLIMLDQVFEAASLFPDIEFSINTSFDDFEEGKLVEYVKEMLITTQIDPSKIIFEILETQTFSDEGKVTQMISELKALGCKIAIDDFGTGHSNFAHVTLMDVDYIKIDGMFVKNLDSDLLSQKMVKTLVLFTKQIGAKTIAEFVHSEAVFDKVLEYGIDFAQGYYLSEPLSRDDLEIFLQSRN